MNLNPWAILAAATSSFLIGGLWYSPLLFAGTWMRAAGVTEAELNAKSPGLVMAGAFGLSLVMAGNLAAFLADGKPDVVWGMTAGALAGAGWVATALGVIYLFERRPWSHFLVNAGYQVVAFVVMGAILGAWK